MALTITHTTPADGTFSATGAAAWDATHSFSVTGTSGQIQYNNAGDLSGMSGTSWNDTTRSLTLSGATVTASAPVFDLSQTWNAAGVTFTGLKFNATDTASAAGSLLLDLQVGGTSKVSVNKTGAIINTLNTYGTSNFTLRGGNSQNYGINLQGVTAYFQTSTTVGIGLTVSGSAGNIGVSNTGSFGFHTTNPGADAIDTMLTRRAAANLRFGAADAAAPVAQTLSVQSVVAGTTNTAGANLTITGSQGTGTGAGGSIIFQVAPAGSSGTSQNALVNSFIIPGAIGEARLVNSLGGSVNFLVSTTSNTNSAINIRHSTGADGIGGTSAGFIGRISGNFGFFDGGGSPLFVQPSGSTDSVSIWGTDVRLARDAANTLALRNGTNAQTFRIYRTTDGTNSEYLASYWAGTTAYILTAGAGTGPSQNLVIGTAANNATLSFWTNAVARWSVNASGHFLAGADNTYDIGASGANRPRDFFLARNFLANGYMAGNYFRDFNNRFHIYSGSTDGTIVFYNQAETGFERMMFGGTTSSFPALKRSTTSLQARLADDSGFTNIQGKLTTDTNYTSGAPTADGYLVLYDATGTAYKVPCVAL